MDNLSLDSKYWLRTNAKIEAYKSLEKLDETLALIKDDVYQWKWAIIILHNCVQAFLVLTLQGTAQIDVLMDNTKDRKRVKQYINGKLPMKYYKLDDFLNLYEKIKSTDSTQLFCCKKKFVATEDHTTAMKKIKEYRDRFVHFFPISWGLCIYGMPEIFQIVMSIIKSLINDIGNFTYQFSSEEMRAIRSFIESIDLKLEKLVNEQTGT